MRERPLSLPCSDWLSWLRLERLLLECELPRLGVGVGAWPGGVATPGRLTAAVWGAPAERKPWGEARLSEKGNRGAGAGAAAAGVTGLETLPLLSRLLAPPPECTRWLANRGDGDELLANRLPLRSAGVPAAEDGVRPPKSCRSRGASPPGAEPLDEWLPLRASEDRNEGCESSSETRLGAVGAGGEGGSPGGRHCGGATGLGPSRGRCGAAHGGGDGGRVVAGGLTGEGAAGGGGHEGPFCSGAGDGTSRARGGLERALGTHGLLALVVVVVVGVHVAVVTAVGWVGAGVLAWRLGACGCLVG